MKTNMHYPRFDVVQKYPQLIRSWSDLETWLLRKKLRPIEQPIFVCGLARAGTTLVTHMLNLHDDTGSFLYRDLPFVEIPCFWSFMSPFYYGKQQAHQRIHGDALSIDPNSPDAFEEMIWKKYLPDLEVLDPKYDLPELDAALTLAMQKILYTRGRKSRYLSKNNYNVLRLTYLLEHFPDARIVLCVRSPFDHAQSLARVHQKFSDIAKEDAEFTHQLDTLGHYEFGPHRKAIRLNEEHYQQTLAHWNNNEDYEGYLLQWLDVYTYAFNAYGNHKNVLWIDHDSLVKNAESTFDTLLSFCNVPVQSAHKEEALSLIKDASVYPEKVSPYDEEVEMLYEKMKSIAL